MTHLKNGEISQFCGYQDLNCQTKRALPLFMINNLMHAILNELNLIFSNFYDGCFIVLSTVLNILSNPPPQKAQYVPLSFSILPLGLVFFQ